MGNVGGGNRGILDGVAEIAAERRTVKVNAACTLPFRQAKPAIAGNTSETS